MKCRLLYAKTVSDPSREDNGRVMPAGEIIDHPDAFWLCRVYQQVLRRLNDESFDLVQMDGIRNPLKYEAEPADLECLMECQKRWPKEFSTVQLKPISPPVAVTADTTSIDQPAVVIVTEDDSPSE